MDVAGEVVSHHRALEHRRGQDRTSPIVHRDRATLQDYATLSLPAAECAYDETGVVITHQHLLGNDVYLDQILEAVQRVNDNLFVVRRWIEENLQAEARQ